MDGVRVEVDMCEGTPLLTLKHYCEKCGKLIISRTINSERHTADDSPEMGATDAYAMLNHIKTCRGAQ